MLRSQVSGQGQVGEVNVLQKAVDDLKFSKNEYWDGPDGLLSSSEDDEERKD